MFHGKRQPADSDIVAKKASVMKKLLLLRHGEAASSTDGQDKTRPLTPKGAADALALGAALKSRHGAPDLILCSSAARTQQTCKDLLQAFEKDIPVEVDNILYNAPCGIILDAVQNVANNKDFVLVVGHNPGLNELAVTMAAKGAPTLMNRLTGGGFMPGTLCALECPCTDWQELRQGKATITDYLSPLDYNSPATPARWT